MFVPSTLLFVPCANHLISFPNNAPQICLYFGCLMRWQSSNRSPVSLSNTVFAYFQRNFRGYFLVAIPHAEIFIPLISNEESTISCVRVILPPQYLVFHDIIYSSYYLLVLPAPSYSVWKYPTSPSGTGPGSFCILYGDTRFSSTLYFLASSLLLLACIFNSSMKFLIYFLLSFV